MNSQGDSQENTFSGGRRTGGAVAAGGSTGFGGTHRDLSSQHDAAQFLASLNNQQQANDMGGMDPGNGRSAAGRGARHGGRDVEFAHPGMRPGDNLLDVMTEAGLDDVEPENGGQTGTPTRHRRHDLQRRSHVTAGEAEQRGLGHSQLDYTERVPHGLTAPHGRLANALNNTSQASCITNTMPARSLCKATLLED